MRNSVVYCGLLLLAFAVAGCGPRQPSVPPLNNIEHLKALVGVTDQSYPSVNGACYQGSTTITISAVANGYKIDITGGPVPCQTK